MENKTKILKLRLTPSRMEEVRRRSKPFGTLSNFINQAINEFSDTTAKDRLDNSKKIAQLYAEIDAKLAHVGGNLNQAMRRINERAVAGLDYTALLSKQLIPEIESCKQLCVEVRKSLRDITIKAT